MQETGISGSILLLSNEVEQVEGLTVTNKDGIGNTGDGFQYGIFDIAFEPEEDYSSIVESFLHWLKRSAEEEQSWFRSAHIGTFPVEGSLPRFFVKLQDLTLRHR